MLELRQEENALILRGDEYELSLATNTPWRARLSVRGLPAAELFVPGACDADGMKDAIVEVGTPSVEQAQDTMSIVIPVRSALWGAVSYVFRGSADSLAHFARRSGTRRIDALSFFSGRLAGAEQLSQPRWRAVFDPEPNACRKHYFEPTEFATIGVSSDPRYYKGNWLFTPGPLCYALELGGRGWLAVGVATPPGRNNFDHFEYRGSAAGFGFHLRYDGHVLSDVRWESPHLLLLSGAHEYGSLERYCKWLRSAGLVPTGRSAQYDWWWEPIFCGWGEQVALERRTALATLPPVIAADYCTQANYERFLAILEEHAIAPGTIVLDDKWQRSYGLNDPDPAKWPDLPGFIARQHAAGRRVLLWLRAWHSEGVPAPECLVDEAGAALAVDPSSPAYEARLRAQVRHMLDALGADGFKIDFTDRLPVAANVRATGGIWGIELLKRLLTIIHDEAKQAKPEALIMAHTAHPYFADVVDMLRLNDIANVVGAPSFLASMVTRAKVAHLASPHWIIDTDNWPSPNRAAWLEYCHQQPLLGVPSLYYATRIYHLAENGEVADEPFRPEDYAQVAALWAAYRAGRGVAP